MTMRKTVEIEVLSPRDLTLLKKVVEEVCPADAGQDEGRIALVAAAAVEIYQSGLTDHDAMVERLRAL